MKKIVIGVIVVVLIALGVWYYGFNETTRIGNGGAENENTIPQPPALPE